MATGCPPADEPGPCEGDGALAITLTPNHGERVPLADGSVLAVFPPPQGGVFTELDVALWGIAEGELQQLQVRVTDSTGASLVMQTFVGSGLPLMCRSDGALAVNGLPVAFSLMYTLQDLDAVAVTFTVDVITDGDTLTESYAMTLQAVEY